jgi:hypothetical protein
MLRNSILRKIVKSRLVDQDQVKLVYMLSLIVGLLSADWNLPVLDNGYYVGFISKSRIYSTYRDLLIEFSQE